MVQINIDVKTVCQVNEYPACENAGFQKCGDIMEKIISLNKATKAASCRSHTCVLINTYKKYFDKVTNFACISLLWFSFKRVTILYCVYLPSNCICRDTLILL